MRISTGTLFDAGVGNMNRQSQQLFKLQQQISANRRVVVPSDDPIASARALEVSQADAVNAQHGANAQTASGRLALTEQKLSHAIAALQSARESAIYAGNGSLTDSDRRSIALDIRAMRDELISLSNSTDGEGNFLFSGFQTNVQPFTSSVAGIQYNGDDGERLTQISNGRQIAVSASGAQTFMRIREGNGRFVVSADPANAGSVTYSPGTVTNPAALTRDAYRIQFTVTGSIATYDVVNLTTATTIQLAQPYTPNMAIQFDGMSVELDGQPENGDAVAISPSANQSVFTTLSNLADALDRGATSALERTALTNALTDAISNVDQAIDHITAGQSLIGTRMRETESTQDVSEALGIQYKGTLAQLQDLDYAKAVSDLIRAQTNLQASQQTFLQTARLSIFDYI